jgi:pimeloyl-ACP methyl ester carboxylesterase
MATILDYYKYALLSTAAYVRLGSNSLDGTTFAVQAANPNQAGGRLPLSIARYLFDSGYANYGSRTVWIIANYYGSDNTADPIASEDTTGFGATLFAQGTEKVLAFRGTEPLEDVIDGNRLGVDLLQADLAAIGLLGMSLPQAVSMVNYMMRLTADLSDGSVPQLHVQTSFERISSRSVAAQALDGRTIFIDFFTTFDGVGLDQIKPGDTVRVTGHSLGGHLALLAARLFPGLINSEVVVFNSPGFDPSTANFIPDFITDIVVPDLAREMGPVASLLDGSAHKLTDELVGLFRSSLLPHAATSFSGLIIIGLESEDLAPGDDNSYVSSFLSNQQVLGVQTHVATEPNSHVIEPFMDALALHAILQRLAPELTLSDIQALLLAGSPRINRSEEGLTEALFTLFLPADRFLTGYDRQSQAIYRADVLPLSDGTVGRNSVRGIGKGDIEARDAFHDAILRIQRAMGDATVQPRLESLVEATAGEILLAATNPDLESNSIIAHRYALKELNPFAIIGANYAPHNKNGELDPYDPVARTSSLTTRWIEDRANFLFWKNIAFTVDRSVVLHPDAPGVRFKDVSLDIKIEARRTAPTLPIADVLMSFIFGGDSTDSLVGAGGNDRLYGGAGTDVLRGKEGDDYLEGGRGVDVYFYRVGEYLTDKDDGKDTILDIDGVGIVHIWHRGSGGTLGSAMAADASVQLSPTQWQSADGRFTYTLRAGEAGR